MLRHLVAVSASLAANGTAGQTFIMNLKQDDERSDLGDCGQSARLACRPALGEYRAGGDEAKESPIISFGATFHT